MPFKDHPLQIHTSIQYIFIYAHDFTHFHSSALHCIPGIVLWYSCLSKCKSISFPNAHFPSKCTTVRKAKQGNPCGAHSLCSFSFSTNLLGALNCCLSPSYLHCSEIIVMPEYSGGGEPLQNPKSLLGMRIDSRSCTLLTPGKFRVKLAILSNILDEVPLY